VNPSTGVSHPKIAREHTREHSVRDPGENNETHNNFETTREISPVCDTR